MILCYKILFASLTHKDVKQHQVIVKMRKELYVSLSDLVSIHDNPGEITQSMNIYREAIKCISYSLLSELLLCPKQ